MGPSSRRPSDSSLPLHEAWMQHEAEWAQLNRVAYSHLYSARILLSFFTRRPILLSVQNAWV